jgi:hypothetical protein
MVRFTHVPEQVEVLAESAAVGKGFTTNAAEPLTVPAQLTEATLFKVYVPAVLVLS